jgi:2-hydroxycyclohexanecarboxyl-CoA dehydrogenase
MPNSDNPRPKDLPECGVLITGGTSGVGLATALEFAAAGVPRIAIAGRDPGRGAAAAARVRDVGAECTFYATDATDTTAAARTAEAAAGFLGGGIDIFVNTTAPRVRPTPFSKVAADDIEGLLTELILPPMRMAHAVLPTMRQQRSGVIINMASDAAKTATPGEALIGAAMAAIVMFTRTLAIEEKRYGIRANVVTPSLISGTGLTDYLLDDGFSGKLFAAASAKADLGVPDAGDVASLIVFLAGPGASRLTGQAISVNGGISAS